MKTNAIYTIHEKGTDFYFYTEHAGGFGYPFAAADFLHSLKYAIKSSRVSQKNICVSPLLEQMEGDYHFPDELENKRIFTKAEKEHLLKLATRQKIPMAIEIDMDADTVSFHFREDEEELQDLCDVTFSRYISREQKYDGSYCRQVLDNLMVSDMFDERDRHIWEQQEEAYRHVIQKASKELMEQQDQGMQQIM